MKELTAKQISEFTKAHASGLTVGELSLRFHMRKADAVALTQELGINRPRGRKPATNLKNR